MTQTPQLASFFFLVSYAVLFTFGCTSTDVYVTEVISRGSPCTADNPMAAIHVASVELFAAPPGSGALLDCSQCSEPNRCELLEVQCRCGTAEPTSLLLREMVVGSLGDADLGPITFADLDPDRRYCIRMIASDMPESSTEELTECECPPEDRRIQTAQVCALSSGEDPGRGATNLAVTEHLCRRASLPEFQGCLFRPGLTE